jgi:hypothetical protein
MGMQGNYLFFMCKNCVGLVRFMVFNNATINNISVILWLSVLLVEETTGLSQDTDKLYHLLLHRVHLTMNSVQTHNVSGDRH